MESQDVIQKYGWIIFLSALKATSGGMTEWKVRDPEVLCAVFTVQHYKDRQLDPCCLYRQPLLIFFCCRTQRATGIPNRPARERTLTANLNILSTGPIRKNNPLHKRKVQ